METKRHVIPGMPIVSSDGTTIGAVKEISGRFFKVDAPLHRDYWLHTDLVGSHTATELQLRVDCTRLPEHRLPRPGNEPGMLHGMGEHAIIGAENSRALRLPRNGHGEADPAARPIERIPSRAALDGQAGALVQDRVLTRYRAVMREEDARRQHRDSVRRAAVIAAGIVAAASGAVAGYRMAASR